MQPMLTIAVRAARSAGDYIMRNLNKAHDLQVQEKGQYDFVTEVDRHAEELIIETLLKSFPDHGIIAEESGNQNEQAEFQWIIDPLDGTTNFLHGFPHFAVSIACQQNNRLEHAVIYDPFKQELFCASRGDGATVNNRRMRVSKVRSSAGTLLGTGFPFRNRDKLENWLGMFNEFFKTAADVRRAGAAALDLAYVADGRLDGFWEFGLQPWDIAAGALLIREAGGLIGDFQGNENYLSSGDVVAANPKLFAEMVRKIQPYV